MSGEELLPIWGVRTGTRQRYSERMSDTSGSKRKPRFTPLGETLIGVGLFVGGWVFYGIAQISPQSPVEAVLALIGGIALILGVILIITGLVRVVRERGKRQALADAANQSLIENVQSPSMSNELRRLDDLHRIGSLSDAEFTAAKAKALGL
jgi:hypothetical protein